MEAIQWAIGILITMLMGVMGYFAKQLSAHERECRQLIERFESEYRQAIARIEGISRDTERMKTDIGTHDSGMRGHLHETANLCTQHELRIALLERK